MEALSDTFPSAGPCGTANIAEPSRFAFRWTVARVGDYARRWGDNPLGRSVAIRHNKGRTGARLTPWWATCK